MRERLFSHPSIQKIKEFFLKNPFSSFVFDGFHSGASALIAALFAETFPHTLIFLTNSDQKAEKHMRELALFSDRQAIHLPTKEVGNHDVEGERQKALYHISSAKDPLFVFTPMVSLEDHFLTPKEIACKRLEIHKSTQIPFSLLKQMVEEMGYIRSDLVSEKGEYAVRGGILDIFPISSFAPYRIEFSDEDIISIRTFDPYTQRSLTQEVFCSLFPINKGNESASLFDYIPSSFLVFEDILGLEDHLPSSRKELSRPALFFAEQELEELCDVTYLSGRPSYSKREPHISKVKFEAFGISHEAFLGFNPFFPVEDSEDALFLFSNDFEKHMLERHHKKHLISGYLEKGFSLENPFFSLVPASFFSGKQPLQREKRRLSFSASLNNFFSLEPEDLVVHMHHGIGKYLGIEKRPNTHGVLSEFFVLEYANKGRLFVPLEHAYLLTKYIGAEDVPPSLHEIGSSKWQRAKEETERAVLTYAKELLQNEAERSLRGGFSFPEDSPMVLDFEEEFPFPLTEDQKKAVEDIKKDMHSSKAMDRLICGDVGYGKTEVAMRATFKAVVDGKKQVALLVPTTILAMQHAETFQERMGNFPINIVSLSRFESPKKIKEILKKIAEGHVDIVIGTHRLLSKDVIFKDLGLVIIDEEQRFGVRAKEKLRQFKIGVDSLMLSATPIPRTLHFSLMGAREISLIHTPPEDRLPVATYIIENEDAIIQEAIIRELAREGQVFYIHNRVETIDRVLERLQRLVPKARILVVHGQMESEWIEDIFHAFREHKADILISTTVIENGVDVPNANTIFIENADKFGLADLYQLKGRVGRWNVKAYAYFLVKNLSLLSEISRKRLRALAESVGLGGGMKIALRDLEIRGAGNILGYEQSGHISSIGFSFYCKLLKRAISNLKGEISLQPARLETTLPAKIPEFYIPEISLRMEFYQRLGELSSLEEIDALFAELKDRFGPYPKEVVWFHHLTRLRIKASLSGYHTLKISSSSFMLNHNKSIPLPCTYTPQELEEQISHHF